MKILMIITRLDQGGSAEAVLQIAEGLSKKGHEIKIITGLTKDPQENFDEYSRRTGIPVEVIEELRREITPFLDIYSLFRLYRLIRAERPDIVHTHTSKAGILGRWAAWLNRIKVIIHSSHGHIFYGYFGSLKTKLFLWIEKLTAMITERVTTLSSLEIDDYERMRLARRGKFITIPYGIDTKRYQRADRTGEEMKRMLGLSPQDYVVGWIGRLVPVKDCGTFLKAASLLKSKIGSSGDLPLPDRGRFGSPDQKNLKFLVVGDGPEREMLEEMTEGLGLEVIFTGMRDDIYDIMSAMDIFVLSSLNEGLGHVLLEAMAAGKPVVATKVGGVPEVVKDGVTGILVPPSDPEGMASAITEILTNPEMMTTMAEEGRKSVGRFDIKVAIEGLETLYRKGGESE